MRRALAAAILLFFATPANAQDITVGSKKFTESVILGEIIGYGREPRPGQPGMMSWKCFEPFGDTHLREVRGGAETELPCLVDRGFDDVRGV